MAWMRMPGQTWLSAATSFLGMWLVMMVAMMLPSLVSALWRYRQAIGRTGGTRLDWLTALVAAVFSSGRCLPARFIERGHDYPQALHASGRNGQAAGKTGVEEYQPLMATEVLHSIRDTAFERSR